MSSTRIGKIIGIVFLLMAFIPAAHAEFYKVRIKKITPQSDTGDVIIQFKPGSTEDKFTGKATATLLHADEGSNKSLAVLLAAVSLGSEAILELDNVPSDVDQAILSTGMAP